MDDTATAYVGRVLDLVEAEWFRADGVDWSDIRGRYLAGAVKAGTGDDSHDIVEALLAELGDGHSHLIRPHRVAAMTDRTPAMPIGQMRGQVASLEIPAFVQNRHVTRETFAGHLQEQLAMLDAGQPTGWVLDLRRNGGGDMWAMLAGLGPMLGEGPFGFFVSSRAFAWTYRDGAAYNDGRLMCRTETMPIVMRHERPKVALLIGPGTASAGEAVGIAFMGRPGTKSFGRPTAGQATANSSHVLSDGAVLAITAAVMADRTGAIHGRVVEPDVAVSVMVDEGAKDATLDRALAWLAGDHAAKA